MTREEEIAWAAGFFDGEGSVGVQRDRCGCARYLSLQIGQRDPRPLQRFQALFGGNLCGPYTNRSRSGFAGDYRLAYSGSSADRVAEELEPALCQPKLEQILLARSCIAHVLPIEAAREMLAQLREAQR
mgnify:CR=1 FL=1